MIRITGQVKSSVIDNNYRIVNVWLKNSDKTVEVKLKPLYTDYRKKEVFAKIIKDDLIDIFAKPVTHKPSCYEAVIQPFVSMPTSSEAVLQQLVFAIKKNFRTAKYIYDTISKNIHGTEKDIVQWLNCAADSFCRLRNSSCTFMFDKYTREVETAIRYWYYERNIRQCQVLGLSTEEIEDSNMSTVELYKTILENPYKVFSIPIVKADNIIRSLAKPIDKIERMYGEFVRIMWRHMKHRGWAASPRYILSKQYPNMIDMLPKLIEDYGIVENYDCLYLPYQHEAESYIGDFFTKSKFTIDYDSIREDYKDKTISNTEFKFKDSILNIEQKLAVITSLSQPLAIITGGAGTGKTRVIAELVHQLKITDTEYLVCAFTGKAVARIQEVVPEAFSCTIHRSLYESSIRSCDFSHIIIDEASMVTSDLLYKLILNFKNVKHITLVGDVNQLLPIGWGSPFEQTISSNSIPVIRLSTCHRVTDKGENNGILINANKLINNPVTAKLENAPNFNIQEGDISMVYYYVESCYSRNVPITELTILTPLNSTVDEINNHVQNIYFGANRHVLDVKKRRFYVGDRIMFRENDYDINIYNGEEGIVLDIDSDKIYVKFKSVEVALLLKPSYNNKYGKDKERTTDKIVHSYCLTIDKSQGSEWNYIIFYVPSTCPTSGDFMNRNRIYTAITRAKTFCWCIGSMFVVNRACNLLPSKRCEKIVNRLHKVLPIIDTRLDVSETSVIEDVSNTTELFDLFEDTDDNFIDLLDE